MPSPRLVRALYRSLLESGRQMQTDLDAGRSLYNAIRSGAVDSYPGVKRDWQREQQFRSRLVDMKMIEALTCKPAYVTLIRSGFEQPIEGDDSTTADQRVDAAFTVLRELDDQNAMTQKLDEIGSFDVQHRTDEVEFAVGDLVEVKGESRGVVYAWRTFELDSSGKPRVEYDVLPHSPGSRFAGRLHRVPQSEVTASSIEKPVLHPAVILYFDGFHNGRHTPSSAMAARYPDDVHEKESSAVEVDTPSILKLQTAEENELVEYLRCDDSTVVHFAMAALEGKWLGEFGPESQEAVQKAMECIESGAFEAARELLERVVEDFPEYSYAWSKLGTLEYRSGNSERAVYCYETALERKPHLLDALTGLGACAARLQWWPVAHRAALQLLNIQPDNEAARLLRDKAIFSTL